MGRPRKTKEQLHLSGMDVRNKGRYESTTMMSPDAVLLSKLTCPTKFRPRTRRAWQHIVPSLVGMGVVSEQDIPSLNMMFTLYNSMVLADEKLEEAEAMEDLDMMEKLDLIEKLTKLRNNNWNASQQIMSKFGIGPTERAKLVLPEKKEESAMEKLFKGAI